MQGKGKILITGAAGFIGFHLAKSLLEKDMEVIGFDNMNDYYPVSLKEDRLKILREFSKFRFIKGDLSDIMELDKVFEREKPEIIVNLAAQAGVRYSITNPQAYVLSNLVGFFNLLECCRKYPITHLMYASSSSVYGGNKKIPFSTDDKTDSPVSFYAATKKSNELMAYSYSHLYQIPATGLRFFTVYGPYGRPDMAYFSFAQKIMEKQPITVYNEGDMYRDFTYVDDIVHGLEKLLTNPPKADESGTCHKVYNLGNHTPVKLSEFIDILEDKLGVKAIREFQPMQPGDVYRTYAQMDPMKEDFGFEPKTSIEEGLDKFVQWFKPYKIGG